MKPFRDPIEAKSGSTSKTFAAPTKEQATTGRFMVAGDNYGVGFKQPVGKESASGIKSGPLSHATGHYNPEDF